MAAALAEVKRTLGDDAVILHTRTIERRAVLGIGRRRCVEITAASANLDLPDRPTTVRVPAVGRQLVNAAVPAEGAGTHMPSATDEATYDAVRLLRSEIDELKERVATLVPRPPAVTPSTPRELHETCLAILGSEVADDLANELLARLQCELSPAELRDPTIIRDRLAGFVAGMLPAGGEIAVQRTGVTQLVALIGPAGVGKTTTIAKLAAEFALRRGCRVGLITLDTRRAGAVVQLRGYAEIIDVPLHVAATPEELRDGLASMRDRDVVLIDTPGCNPRDPAALADLHEWLSAARDCEKHIVLPAGGSRSALHCAVEAFARIGGDRVLFTKLDESVGCGLLLECLRRAKMRLSYVTNGPSVASDRAVAAPMEAARQMVFSAAPTGEEQSS